MRKKVWFCQECRIMMEPVNEDFCRCPQCGSEVWYNYSADKVKGKSEEPGAYVSLSMQEGERVLGGGSGVSCVGKHEKKKRSPQQLYNQLFKET